MDMPAYRIFWPTATTALPGLQDYQVSVPIHITAKFMQNSSTISIDGHAHLLINNA